MPDNNIKIFLVDDDLLFLKLMKMEFLQRPEYSVETYASGELCLNNLSNNPDVVVLDYHLNGTQKNAMNGMETLNKIKEYNSDIQVIMLSSQDDVDIAIDSMHHKAIDYVVKSETAFLRIEKIILSIVNFKEMEKGLRWYVGRI